MVPAGQLVQLAAPAVLLYAPLVQAKQLDAPFEPEVAEDRVPAAHVKHPAAPLAL